MGNALGSTRDSLELNGGAVTKDDKQRRRYAVGLAALLVVAAKVGAPMLRTAAGPAVAMVGAAAEAAKPAVEAAVFDATKSLVGPGLTKFLQIAPVVTCQLVAVSAWKMMMDIKRVKSTATLSPMPFTAMLTNSVVWGLYGFGKRDITMLTPQVLSLLGGTYYTYVFAQYTKKGSTEDKTLKRHLLVGGLMSAVTLFLAVVKPLDTIANPLRSYELCGQIGVLSSVLLSVGPGATIFQVLRTGNTSSMPFYQSLLAFLNNIGWTSYGWFVSRDPLAWGPNLLGLFFTTCQMLAFAMYGVQTLEKKEDEKK